MSKHFMKHSKDIKNNKTLKLCTILLCIIFVCPFLWGNNVDADTIDEEVIRVGLEGLYYNVSAVNVRNDSITLGYCYDNRFVREVTFSGGGFSFTPYVEAYSTKGNYDSYEEAYNSAKKKGNNCLPMVTFSGKWTVATLGSGNFDSYAVRLMGDNVDILFSIDEHDAYPQIISNGETVDLGERQYRGRIEVGTYGGNALKAINVVELEEYLYSVVSCEMSASWHMEALKAQAVCARSYAVCSTGFGGATNIETPYTINDTTASQVYRGLGSEQERAVEAVKATTGEMIYYRDEVVRGFYSSTSGGSTENVEDLWGSPKGYLRQVSDIYELEPELAPWVIKLSSDNIENILAQNGINVGNVTDIRPSIYTASGRVYAVDIIGDGGRHTMTGEDLRIYLSLYSTKYKVVKYGDNPDYVTIMGENSIIKDDISDCYIIDGDGNTVKASATLEQYVAITEDNLINYPRTAPEDKDTYYLAGMGYGHGIGLSQSGAKGMADNGFGYIEILKHYFTDVEIR